ncbi:hypothetical protein FPZ54_06495 [Sphingomonas suaedae]|uniref:Uncharacterized protein n=1 Tax=Sphingomonas suaedae TaxID=2599297 RepID=A0A518RE58_9SPHN|nr:hypothetical protein [Sphingomonas suaedae]QDX25704.1 hypothetical protein FPZ54_06495 [Sphingomonas suaedae]
MTDTPDLFGHTPAQGSLFGEGDGKMTASAREPQMPTPELARARLHRFLETARAAETMPWDARRARVVQIIFPQMARWLPEDEADQLCMEFMREVERLKAA